MASNVAEQFIRANFLFQVWDHDPGAATAVVTSPDGGTTQRWVDMRDHERFAAVAIQTVLAGTGITKVEIVAATDSAGTNLTVIKDSGAITLTTLTSWHLEECSADEVRHAGDAAGYALRYVAARITQQNSGDEAVVVYFTIPNRAYLDLTPANTVI